MNGLGEGCGGLGTWPDWVPEGARHYLAHTDAGRSIRALARDAGCHASTVLRQVRRIEARRDDPLVDQALRRLEGGLPALRSPHRPIEDFRQMTAVSVSAPAQPTPDDATVTREARRILRRLNEPGACLAIARDMENAVVVRESADERTVRTAVVGRAVAEALALKDWIACKSEGRISRYRITTAGRAALKRLLAEEEAARGGFAEAAAPFGDQHRDLETRRFAAPGAPGTRRRARYNTAESPLALLARRRDKNGEPFLSSDLVAAGERLREDFELAQMGPRITQNWDKFLTAGARSAFAGGSPGEGPQAARDRVIAALGDLGPGLGDVALRCCCFLEGMEAAERRMGWSARSGKIVLRIALQRLKRHYDETENGWSPMIG